MEDNISLLSSLKMELISSHPSEDFVSNSFLERLTSLEIQMQNQIEIFSKVGKEIDLLLELKHGNTILATLFGAISVFFKNDLRCVTALVMIISVLYSIYITYYRLSRSVTRELRNLNTIMAGLLRAHAELVAEGELLMEYVQEAIAVTEEEDPTIRMSDYIRRLRTIVESSYHRGYIHPRNLDSKYYLALVTQIFLLFFVTYFAHCHNHGRFL